ncbi:hypothetical protein L1987_10744 [Smallanthus sonchifolius]|uniref:Uncharacterized protein n=1 Tax=Smallanthus sonchifolius TaxID=185202 RepID=A0ACB9J9G9_9ASTR|nr:hypothetical protein L1987_10744 [Smallanthus sonchifolius]
MMCVSETIMLANPLDPSNFPFILLDNCPNFIISPGWIKVCQNTQLIDSLVEVIEPFSILGLQHGATDFEIKKAYRNLGL